MADSLRHRGPDFSDSYTDVDAAAGLAHARLSIIDLMSGNQPMANAERSLWVVFNGEIFNYVELRADLVRKGRRFATESDTEVILQMYEEYGEECVAHFNGDWAFAIWDARKRRLFLSRDRVGVRPLFYAITRRNVVFASEIKALLCHNDVTSSIDLEALDQVFTFWCPVGTRTLFAGINELPPGHNLVLQDGDVRVWPYWQLDYSDPDGETSEERAADNLLELLSDSTRIRLRSDVPVGAYLSGGLDSSVIAALTKQWSGSRLRTFSVNFDDVEFDEGAFQQDVIDRLGTDHQSIRCSYGDICRVFPDVVWHAERPVLRTAPAPLYLLSQLVHREGYKVVLTGEGADEFLGGYDIFKEAKIRRFWAADPGSRCRPMLLKRLYPYMPNLQAQSDVYRKSFFHVNPQDLGSPFFSHLPRWELTTKLKTFLSEDVRHALAGYDGYREARAMLPEQFERWNGMSKAQYLEATMLLPGYILSSQGDRMAMAHSVEGRFPFLDYRVIEFAARMPARWRMKTLNEKYLLKRAAGHLVPDSVKSRPKQPYRAPDAKSFFDPRTGVSRADYVDEMLSDERIKSIGLFNPSAVQRLVAKARQGNIIGAKDSMALVGILSTQLLATRFGLHSTGSR